MNARVALLFTFVVATAVATYGHDDDDDGGAGPCSAFRNVRSINGSCNNFAHPNWGVSGGNFSEIEGYKIWPASSPNEREISNRLFANTATKEDIFFNAAERRSGTEPDPRNRNQFFVAFGQFIAHDLGHNPLTFNVANIFANYKVQILDPTDPLYEPNLNNKTGILTQVSLGHLDGDRFYSTNGGNSFLDLGPVYGSLDSVSNLLRSFQGGRLLTDPSGEYLPFDALIGAPSECGAFRVGVSAAGDLRSDENPVLTSVHTLFMREHNRLADQFAAANPSWSDEQLFQAARTELIALYQHIVYDEWLPELLGRAPIRRLGRYSSYRRNLDPTVGDTFSASAFRLLHDLVNLPLLTIDESCNLYLPDPTDGRPTQEGSNCIPLFFRAVGLEASLRGSINQFAQAQDHKFANGLRNVLLRATTRGGNLDIETANIFRGRDHQLLDFNSLRKFYTGKSIYEERRSRCNPGVVDSIECFLAITSNSSAAAILRDLYGKVSNIDSYVGLAVEDIQRNSFMPETATAIILEQFDRTRSADRFWYENRRKFSSSWINQIKQVKFADIIRRNTAGLVVNDEVFKVHDQCNWNSIPAPAPLHARMQRG